MKVAPDQLRARLDETKQHTIENTDADGSFLRDLAEKPNLRALFEEIRTNKSWREEVAKRSYIHDNGFDKLKLIVSEDPAYKLRLHVWWPENTPQEPESVNFHDHRWDFHSILISGQMRFMNYDTATSEGMPVHEYKYSPVGDQEEYQMGYLGQTKLKRRFGGTLHTGVDYTISHDVIHKTYVPSNCLTATMLVQGPGTDDIARVFSKEQLDNDSIDASRMTVAELDKRIERLKKTVL
jgi:hypothetical protein